MITFGSARSSYGNKTRGDQKQTEKRDTKGEVSYQDFYVHEKGWYILRAKSNIVGHELAMAMRRACKNKMVGYSQDDRYSIIGKGTNSEHPVNCDCSSLIRQCIIEAASKDPGDFNTANEVEVLQKTGLFSPTITYRRGMDIYNGDIFVTQSKGHTVIVVGGALRRL